jgi:FlaA1/EpsC-like NDP-sugar epimerase
MLSTDKAVRPEGVMGATKRIAEFLMADANDRDGLRCITVRFGNVLGSRGSVVPLFIRQIRDGGPVTVSDEQATRFFMTQKEACMLVVEASVRGHGGEIFILKMGKQIRIVEMAKDLIALHGLRPNDDIAIEVVGLREGEKMHEDLVVEGEQVTDATHDRILASRSSLPSGWKTEDVLNEFARLAAAGEVDDIKRYLTQLIPDSRIDASESTSQ